jgi:hypothetical protein
VLTEGGRAFLDDLGVVLPAGGVVVRYCVDWSEQRHHLSGATGRAVLARLLALDWIRRIPAARAVRVTPAGRTGLAKAFGIEA